MPVSAQTARLYSIEIFLKNGFYVDATDFSRNVVERHGLVGSQKEVVDVERLPHFQHAAAEGSAARQAGFTRVRHDKSVIAPIFNVALTIRRPRQTKPVAHLHLVNVKARSEGEATGRRHVRRRSVAAKLLESRVADELCQDVERRSSGGRRVVDVAPQAFECGDANRLMCTLEDKCSKLFETARRVDGLPHGVVDDSGKKVDIVSVHGAKLHFFRQKSKQIGDNFVILQRNAVIAQHTHLYYIYYMGHESKTSSVSSEMWGDDTVRLDGAYHIAASSLQTDEDGRGGYTRLVVATRYGRKLMLKALREDVRGVLQYEELLRKEFEILFTLNHDNIVRTFAMEEVEGLGRCIVMEYLEGMTLAQWLEARTAGAMDSDDHKAAAEAKHTVLTEILRAVDYIHSRGVLHRDLTLANIIVLPDNRHIRLIDFGFADSAAYEVLKQPCGTPGFVAPEQRAGISDVRNDIYSIGCIMQTMQLDPAYAPIINKCLLPLAERPSSARELLQTCEQIRQPATSKKPIPYLFVIPVLLAIIAIGGWLLMPDALQTRKTPSGDTELSSPTSSPTALPSPPDVSIGEGEQKAYKRIMTEGQRMIDRDVRRMDQIMDTVSQREYIPADYIDFLSEEAQRIHQFAASHQSSLPTHYAAFYDSIFSYYTIRYASKWSKRTTKLYAE